MIDWETEISASQLIDEAVVAKTARRCVFLSAELGLRSIAFTPWGTKFGGAEASHITAVMLQAITSVLRERAGDLYWLLAFVRASRQESPLSLDVNHRLTGLNRIFQ